jgi:hypothetical protein
MCISPKHKHTVKQAAWHTIAMEISLEENITALKSCIKHKSGLEVTSEVSLEAEI